MVVFKNFWRNRDYFVLFLSVSKYYFRFKGHSEERSMCPSTRVFHNLEAGSSNTTNGELAGSCELSNLFICTKSLHTFLHSHAKVSCPCGGSRCPPLFSRHFHSPNPASQLPDTVLSKLGHNSALHPVSLDAEQQRSVVRIQAKTLQFKSVESLDIMWMWKPAHRRYVWMWKLLNDQASLLRISVNIYLGYMARG